MSRANRVERSLSPCSQALRLKETSPLSPLRSGEGNQSLPPPSLPGKGAGGLGFFSSRRHRLIQLIQQPAQLRPEDPHRLPRTTTLRKRRVIEILHLDPQAAGDVIFD